MKGYVLTVDVAFGAVLAIFILATSMSLMQGGYSAGVEALAVKRMAADIVTILDYNGTLDTLDEGLIRSGVRHILPPSLEMGINITVYDDNSQHVQDMAMDYETEKNRYGGRHSFIIFSGNRAEGFAVADYWVTVK